MAITSDKGGRFVEFPPDEVDSIYTFIDSTTNKYKQICTGDLKQYYRSGSVFRGFKSLFGSLFGDSDMYHIKMSVN